MRPSSCTNNAQRPPFLFKRVTEKLYTQIYKFSCYGHLWQKYSQVLCDRKSSQTTILYLKLTKHWRNATYLIAFGYPGGLQLH